jgi:putative transcriptional regulator
MPRQKASRRAPERGHRVAVARKRSGLSQRQLADRTGVARSTVARIELGVHQPSVTVALAIARELNTTTERLFGGGR